MADYRFPASTLDDRHKLLARIGGFWSRTYTGNDVVASILFARAQEEKQTKRDFQETVACLSRRNVPTYHQDAWYQLRVFESEAIGEPLRYGAGAVYGEQPGTNVVYTYGGSLNAKTFKVALPDGLRFIPVITNRITQPSMTLVYGVDFVIEDGYLIINQNLFENENLIVQPVYTDDQVTDRAIALWVFESLWDWDYMYNHFGYLIGGPKPSSDNYSDFVNAVIDALVSGTAHSQIEAVFAAVTGNPTAKEAETVELVTSDRNHLVVVTDKNAYKFPKSATAIVAAGDELLPGDQMTDTVTFYSFTNGTVSEDIQSLHLDTGFLVSGFAGGLTFDNKDVDLVVEEAEDGKTKVSFELGGYPADVDSFFDQMHERASELGKPTLAELLDVRGPDQTTQPAAASLPATINPCEFLVANVLRFHCAAVKIKTTSATATDLRLIDAKVLRKLIPPWQSLLILFELEFDTDVTNFGDFEDGDAGYDETATMLNAGEPIDDSVTPSVLTSEDVTMTYIECLCE